jgi:hypothetical protein
VCVEEGEEEDDEDEEEGYPDAGSNGGEAACENQGFGESECSAIGCCQYDDGQCWSAVGNGPCNSGRRLVADAEVMEGGGVDVDLVNLQGPEGPEVANAAAAASATEPELSPEPFPEPETGESGEVELPDASLPPRLPAGRRLADGRRLAARFNGLAWTLEGSSGTITFTVGLGGSSAAALAFGDVDADGDLDLIIANTNSPNELWINNGSGVFNSRSTFDAGGYATTTAVALGDADGDGRLDVLVGNSGSANELLLQKPDGSFEAAAGFSGGSAETHSVAFGDIDGDGELDLLAGNGGANGGANELLMLTHCPDGGAQLHAGSSCFACPPSMGKSSPSVCLECVPDFMSEGTDGTLGPGCRKACVLAQRPLGSDSCQECKNVPGNVGAVQP